MTEIKNLALVDDDDIFVFLTKKTIQLTNLVNLVKVFGNGLDAINFLKDNRHNIEYLPEVILLDLSMPIMNGWQFLDEFTKLKPTLGKKLPFLYALLLFPTMISQEQKLLMKFLIMLSNP